MDVPNLPDNPQDDIEAYVGLARQDAEDQARERGWTTVRSLPPGAIITMEYLAYLPTSRSRTARCTAPGRAEPAADDEGPGRS